MSAPPPASLLRRLLQLLLMGLLLLLVASISYGFYLRAISQPVAAALPEQLAGLPLVDSSFGVEAVALVTQLHEQEFPLSSGAFGMYQGAVGMGMLWVAGAPLAPISTSMLHAMETAIAEGESPFTPIGELQRNGRTIYALTGMNQNHYYFQSGNLIVWLAADPAVAERALTDSLRFYP